jgi:hypothetical protein
MLWSIIEAFATENPILKGSLYETLKALRAGFAKAQEILLLWMQTYKIAGIPAYIYDYHRTTTWYQAGKKTIRLSCC